MIKNISCFLFLALVFFSCKKEAGDGGNSSLRGKVLKDVRALIGNPNTFQATVPAADQDVFIVYGEHISPDDKVQADYKGEYEFLYLRPGKYTVYVFSKDTNNVAVGWDEDHMTILEEVEIQDKKSHTTVADMTIYDTP